MKTVRPLPAVMAILLLGFLLWSVVRNGPREVGRPASAAWAVVAAQEFADETIKARGIDKPSYTQMTFLTFPTGSASEGFSLGCGLLTVRSGAVQDVSNPNLWTIKGKAFARFGNPSFEWVVREEWDGVANWRLISVEVNCKAPHSTKVEVSSSREI